MYSYYSRLWILPIKNEEINDTHKEVFNNIPHFIKYIIHVNCLHHGVVMYNDNVLIFKQEVIALATDYMIQVYCFFYI